MLEQFIPLAPKTNSCGFPSVQRLARCAPALKASIGSRFPVYKRKVIKETIVRRLYYFCLNLLFNTKFFVITDL